MFVYTYTDTDPIKNIYTTQKNNNNTKTLLQQSSQLAATTHNNFPQTKSSLVNATKLEYNIISNTYQPGNDVLNRNVINFLYLVELNKKEKSCIKVYASRENICSQLY